jgi:serine/threonine protein kinase
MQSSDTPFSFRVPAISRKKFEKLYTYNEFLGSGSSACVHSVTDNESGKTYALKIVVEDHGDCRSTMDEVNYGCLLGKRCNGDWNPVIAWSWMWESELPYDVEFRGFHYTEGDVDDDDDEKRYIVFLSPLLEDVDVRGEVEPIFEFLHMFDQMQKWKIIHGDISCANILYKKVGPRSYSIEPTPAADKEVKVAADVGSSKIITITYPYQPCFIDMASATIYDDQSLIAVDQKHVIPYKPANLQYLLTDDILSFKNQLMDMVDGYDELEVTLTKILEQPLEQWVSLFSMSRLMDKTINRPSK